jgi:hypothetical protein
MTMQLVVRVMILARISVRATFGLERSPSSHELGTKSLEHGFDHVIGSDAQDPMIDLGRQVPVAQMPGQSRELMQVRMPDFDHRLQGGAHFEPPAVLELQPIAIGHRDSLRELQENVLALIGRETQTPAVALLKLESEGSRGLLPGPLAAGAVNRCMLKSHINTGNISGSWAALARARR